MNMKKYITYLAFVFVLISGCTDEFLEEEPRDRITADDLYTTPTGFENGLNALYAQVRLERTQDGGINGTRIYPAQGASDAYYRSRFGSVDNAFVEYGSFLNSNTEIVSNLWSWLYETINAANTIVVRADDPNVTWESDAQKNEVVGQAKVIRAWAYRHLINLWGDVPLTLDQSTGTTIRTDWERDPVATVMQAMESDLLDAEQGLPEQQTTPGRLSKAVAQHYLAELYLMMDDPEQAAQKAQAAIDNPNFSLITERYGVRAGQPGVPFMDQFYDGNVLFNQGNTEILWALPYDRDVLGGGDNVMRRSWMIRYSVNAGVPVSPERGRGSDFFAVTPFALDLYEPQDDRGSEFAIHRYVLTDAGDTLFTSSEGYGDSLALREPLYPSTRKWDDGDPDNVGTNDGYRDQPYLRLAETYLLLAEALHLQGDNAGAAEALNTVRSRSNASEITAADVSIDFILDERIRELLTEEHRRYTLLRVNKWLERTRAHNPQSAPFITEREQLLPIPQVVIDTNIDRVLPQNPGYASE